MKRRNFLVSSAAFLATTPSLRAHANDGNAEDLARQHLELLRIPGKVQPEIADRGEREIRQIVEGHNDTSREILANPNESASSRAEKQRAAVAALQANLVKMIQALWILDYDLKTIREYQKTVTDVASQENGYVRHNSLINAFVEGALENKDLTIAQKQLHLLAQGTDTMGGEVQQPNSNGFFAEKNALLEMYMKIFKIPVPPETALPQRISPPPHPG